MTILTVKRLLDDCIEKQVSDLYFLPCQQVYQLRYRDATGLHDWHVLKAEQAQRFCNQLKFQAQMAISETRRPQLGSQQYSYQQVPVFLRLSTVGNFQNAESLVVRFIYSVQEAFHFIFPGQLQQLQQLALKRGLLVFSGPTGSGKTTSLYRLAESLDHDQVVMTIEDPVEIYQPHFLQLQVNDQAGMTYQSLLKVGLRQRPDIFIIGEIRDENTAAVAARAALSGHLVLSTVHAQSALKVRQRLQDLGLREAILANCLTAVCYQRLLPLTHGGLAALCDIVTPTGRTSQWSQLLERAVQTHQITKATASAFAAG